MTCITIVYAWVLSSLGVSIVEPVDGGVYQEEWLSLRALVTNDNELPDSVVYSLNGGEQTTVPRLVTDWFTYMANDQHTGFSQSPAPLEGTLLWAADSITGPVHEFCSPVVVDGTVYHVSDQQSTVFALDAATGAVIWSYDVVAEVDDAVTWYDGMVYAPADSAFCLDASTGERIWSFKPSSSDFKMNGTPALGDGVAYFSYAPNWNSMEIYALDAYTGEELWCTLLPSYSTGCVTLDGSMLFVPTYNGSLYALQISDGQILWTNSSAPSGYWDSSPVVVDDVIYICDNAGYARGIQSVTGETIWEKYISSWYIAATPAFAYGRMFFADQVDSFHCLEGLDGDQVWSVPGVQHGSPGIADGVVFFGEGADRDLGEIRALSAETGTEIWSYPTEGSEIFSSPAITDGIVYIAGMDWKLYAIGPELRYSYLGEFDPQPGSNQLVVVSWVSGAPAAADTVEFTVTGEGVEFGPSQRLGISVTPNPSNTGVSVSFLIQEPGETSISVFDLTGREIFSCACGHLAAGSYSFQWDGSLSRGTAAPPGIYLCRVSSGSITETTGVCLVR